MNGSLRVKATAMHGDYPRSLSKIRSHEIKITDSVGDGEVPMYGWLITWNVLMILRSIDLAKLSLTATGS